MEKRRLISLMLAGVMATSVGAMAGCDEYRGQYEKQEYKFAVIEENGTSVLHAVKDYYYNNQEKAIVTECCNNEIVVPYLESKMYKNKPSEIAYDVECGLNK